MVLEVTNMDDAVRMAQRLTEKGDTVLLSPACASFDLFENYEDRGNQFKQAVHNL
jgi:UDP-N-acetylmuramoylalanine--D-glutamate ligase